MIACILSALTKKNTALCQGGVHTYTLHTYTLMELKQQLHSAL